MFKKKKYIKILVITLTVLLLLSSCGGFVYFQINQTSTFASTLQQNITLLDQNYTQNNTLTQEVIQKLQEPQSADKINQFKQDFSTLEKKISEFSDQTSQLKNSLKQIDNPDILEFNLQSKKLLDFRVEHLGVVNKIISLNLCYLDKTDLLYSWLPETNKKWSDLNSQNEVSVVATLASESAKKIDENIPILTELKDCFSKDFSDSLSSEVDISLQKETQEYNNLSVSLKKLASSLTTLNSSDYQSSLSEIGKINQTQSAFGKKINQTLNETIRQNLTKTNQKVIDQEVILNRIIQNLQTKYKLNTNL
jgi:hypothetical protein